MAYLRRSMVVAVAAVGGTSAVILARAQLTGAPSAPISQVVAPPAGGQPPTANAAAVSRGDADGAPLGIAGAEVSPGLAAAIHLPVDDGVLVGTVRPGSPAARAGLRGGSSSATVDGRTLTVGGDIIVSVDGRRVARLSDLTRRLANLRPGAHITLGIIRGGQDIEVPVMLGARAG
jgi:S1-C subfamily serine protease